jgi:Flp pilus assembly protein TadD
LGASADAYAVLSRALSLDKNDDFALANIGVSLVGLERDNDAVVVLSRALLRRPNDVVALTNLAIALYNQGQVDEATTTFKRALTLAPSNEILRNLQPQFEKLDNHA